MAYQWMHFQSFTALFDVLGIEAGEFAERLLVVDIGCGPATAFNAIGEWLHLRRGSRLDARYIGIDRSANMREIAAYYVADGDVFQEHHALFLDDLVSLTPEIVSERATDRDHIVVLMSYVMHQAFLIDGALLRRVLPALYATRLPIHVLAQDANKPIEIDGLTLWPQLQLSDVLDDSLRFGYQYGWRKERFHASRFEISIDGCVTPTADQGDAKSIAMAARLQLDNRTYVPYS